MLANMDSNRLAENLSGVQQRVADACKRAGREPAAVTLVAVTKNETPQTIADLLKLGVGDIGENRQQSAFERLPQVPALAPRFAEPPGRDGPRLHFIGPLQRNKAARVAAVFDVIHSVDSLRLAGALSRSADSPLDVFIQINIAREAQKHGLRPEDGADAAEICGLPGLRVLGLMCMAPYADDPEEARPHFRALAELSGEWRASGVLPQSANALSMGMSGDFEQAIEEGATHVRVGSALFAAPE
jgi:PLP dependent protein